MFSLLLWGCLVMLTSELLTAWSSQVYLGAVFSWVMGFRFAGFIALEKGQDGTKGEHDRCEYDDRYRHVFSPGLWVRG